MRGSGEILRAQSWRGSWRRDTRRGVLEQQIPILARVQNVDVDGAGGIPGDVQCRGLWGDEA
jgi:hypothetical protein